MAGRNKGRRPYPPCRCPEVNRFHDVGTDVEPDLCGTGTAMIDIAFDVRGVESPASHNADYRARPGVTIPVAVPCCSAFEPAARCADMCADS